MKPDELTAKVIRGLKIGLLKTAMKLHEVAVMYVPVGNADNWQNPKAKPKGYVGGRLRNSLSYSILGTTKGGNSGAGPNVDKNAFVEPSESEYVARVGTRVDYAGAIEFGHSKQAMSGYLRPAYDAIKGHIADIIRESIIEELNK